MSPSNCEAACSFGAGGSNFHSIDRLFLLSGASVVFKEPSVNYLITSQMYDVQGSGFGVVCVERASGLTPRLHENESLAGTQ